MALLTTPFCQVGSAEPSKAVTSRIPLLGLLARAAVDDFRQHSKDMAASIAYFGMLSLFPLILGLIALTGNVLKYDALRAQVMDWVNEFFPIGADIVTQNIESLIRLRGPAGLASVVVLLWSASKMVGAISRGINKSLDLQRSHALLLGAHIIRVYRDDRLPGTDAGDKP